MSATPSQVILSLLANKGQLAVYDDNGKRKVYFALQKTDDTEVSNLFTVTDRRSAMQVLCLTVERFAQQPIENDYCCDWAQEWLFQHEKGWCLYFPGDHLALDERYEPVNFCPSCGKDLQ